MTEPPARRPRPYPTPPPVEVEPPRGATPGWLLPALAAFVLAVLAVVDVRLALVRADRRHEAHRAGAVGAPLDPQPPDIAAAQRAATASAAQRIPALLSYDYRHLDDYLAQAQTSTTGEYRARLTRLIRTVVAPAAARQRVTTKAELKAVGVISVHADQVQLLVFVDQSTTSTAARTGRVDVGRERVTMVRTGGSWLVADLTAV